jgi:hypothetical protein
MGFGDGGQEEIHTLFFAQGVREEFSAFEFAELARQALPQQSWERYYSVRWQAARNLSIANLFREACRMN